MWTMFWFIFCFWNLTSQVILHKKSKKKYFKKWRWFLSNNSGIKKWKTNNRTEIKTTRYLFIIYFLENRMMNDENYNSQLNIDK